VRVKEIPKIPIKLWIKLLDAIHVATIINNGLQAIATEDQDF